MKDNLIGTQLGPYQIQAQIDHRRTKIIYEAYDVLNDRPVTLKVLTRHLNHVRLRKDFEKYGQHLTHLDHPNILKVYDHGIEPESNHAYLVSPYVEGDPLDKRLGQPWPIPDTVRIAAQIGRALDYAHQVNLTHGDLRPRNIFLTQRGWVLLTDFSLARVLELEPADEMKAYQMPDTHDEEIYSQANDLYALGLVTYEMLTGHPPKRREKPRSLRRQRSEVPRSLAKVVAQALSPNTGKRHVTAAEMARALEESLPPNASSLLPDCEGRVTPPSGIKAAITLSHQASDEISSSQSKKIDSDTAEEPIDKPEHGNRILNFLWQATKWVAGKVAAAAVVLLIVATALLTGGAFAIGTMAKQALTTQEWYWQGWEEGGVSIIPEEDVQKSFSDAVQTYTMNMLNDPSVDFHPPDAVLVQGDFQNCSLTLQAQLSTQKGVLVIDLKHLNGIPLYVVGHIISNQVNEGLRSSWEDAPVQLMNLEVQKDQIRAELEPVTTSQYSQIDPVSTSRTVIHTTNHLALQSDAHKYVPKDSSKTKSDDNFKGIREHQDSKRNQPLPAFSRQIALQRSKPPAGR